MSGVEMAMTSGKVVVAQSNPQRTSVPLSHMVPWQPPLHALSDDSRTPVL
jgi:hypothetical protein